MKIAAIGEGMLELNRLPDGRLRMAYGGDTLNTAIYLARCGIPVDYATALGDDPLSDEMIASWRDEGIGTGLVMRLSGRVPGLYMIRIDDRGERSFLYWRSQSPARELFEMPGVDERIAALVGYDWLYLSGITLSLYGEGSRAALFALIDRARDRGCRIAFDGNYRPAGWPDPATAQRAIGDMIGRTDIALPTLDDERALFGDTGVGDTVHRMRAAGVTEIVVKLGAAGCFVATADKEVMVPVEQTVAPVDTTAAGDSFNAGYLAGRLAGLPPVDAARLGHRLAAAVIRHPGAIMPREAMPEDCQI